VPFVRIILSVTEFVVSSWFQQEIPLIIRKFWGMQTVMNSQTFYVAYFRDTVPSSVSVEQHKNARFNVIPVVVNKYIKK
jgi:hypothetical protein